MLMNKTNKSKKKAKRGLFNKVFSIVFCIVTFGLMLTMADLFSSLITVGGYSFVSDNISFSEYKVFAVSTSDHSEKLLASEFCETIKQQGGAGYLYMNNDSFSIVAGIYQTEADAKKVLSNIIEKNPEAKVITITIPQIIISSNLSSQEKNTLSGCLSIFKTAYKKLYDISVSLDTAVINEVNARLDINELSSSVQTTLSNFNTIFTTDTTTELLRIKLALEDCLKYLHDLIDSNLSYPYSSLVKECYCKIIMCYKAMAEQI